jgi:hypothetical protein
VETSRAVVCTGRDGSDELLEAFGFGGQHAAQYPRRDVHAGIAGELLEAPLLFRRAANLQLVGLGGLPDMVPFI